MPARTTPEDQFARIAPYYDALMANVPYGLWAEYVSHLAVLAGRPILPGARVLDLATGTGSVALQFAYRGCAVTGVDLSAAMIRQAKRKTKLLGLPVTFSCQDLADFTTTAQFDHALCLYDSLNYITNPDRLKRTFANVRKALQPEGLFIFDVNTVRALEDELFTQQSRPEAEVEYRWKSKYNPGTRLSMIRMNFTLRSTGEKFAITQRERAYTDAELRSYLHHAGFGEIKSYDGYRIAPLGPHSDRAFYIAKPI